ncbi:hypothetical protein BIV57_11380 [Mangrovactinospora gilvigrisea]|uniref:Sugar ABC transporter substrate-binding protein n=1 Tax=Mangrovactinospora gilvigrisea TaxID=1428644 RepID=A0A1J7BF79_9ACTN|nr:hypothetical protein [Mangrovactinospora gilvigrisea]OIV37339.1 hypothetical protein BIV57_11380 [Mangrovactinospora gilvigrisea]
MSTASPSRRTLLAATGAAAAAVGLPALSACGGSAASGSGGAAKSAKTKLPVYAPGKTATPDIAGQLGGVDPVYLRYPANPVKSVASAPGDGKPISVLTETWTTPMPSGSSNQYLAELNKRLGSTLDMTVTQDVGDGYLGKFNSIIAGGQIPELVWFPPNQGLQKVPQLLQAKFHDLTPYLSGSAVKKYPNLAGLPTYSWKTSVIDGKIAGVTVTQGHLGQVYVVNADFWKPVGGATFTSADDFFNKCKELLDAKRKKYVLEPFYPNAVHMFGEWYGAPNGWRNEGGKLTANYETDEYLAAIEFAVKCRQANLFWPDVNVADASTKVQGGQQLGAYVEAQPSALVATPNLSWPADVIIPFPAHAGAKVHFDLNYGSIGFTAISNQVDKARIPTLLNVMNYLAAPFGTEEHLFLHFGIEGRDWARTKDGDVKSTAQGQSEAVTTYSPVGTFTQGPSATYAPGAPARAKHTYQVEKQLAAMAWSNPVNGLYSDTYTNKGAELSTTMSTLLVDVVAGRKKISDWKAGVKTWRSQGGDAMRHEYEQALAKA